MMYDVCVIGGGAAGLAAAASFNKDLKVCLIEKNDTLGRKIAATGGGRCNLTNEACKGSNHVLKFFNGLGLETFADSEGRYYPYSERASDVVETLVSALSDNITVLCGTEVTGIGTAGATVGFAGTETGVAGAAGADAEVAGAAGADAEVAGAAGADAEVAGFVISVYTGTGKKDMITARRVLLAMGGKAAPQYGTTGDGYGIARSLGHAVTRVFPILSGIECSAAGADFKQLKGIRAKGVLTLHKDGETVLRENNEMPVREAGEIQFTEDGISGICAFNLTPYIRAEEGESPADAMKRYGISVDLAPDFSEDEIAERTTSFGIVTKKLADAVRPAELKNWKLQVVGIKGWKNAQATSGGVKLSEINMETMESRIVKGLYFAGEIIDVQGPCGGFNLQNAWETGIRAAKAINDGK